MQIIYLIVQVSILAGAIWLNEDMKAATGEGVSGLAVAVLAVGVAAFVTAIIYWSIEGVRWFLGKPRNPPLIPPTPVFDNLKPLRLRGDGAQAREPQSKRLGRAPYSDDSSRRE